MTKTYNFIADLATLSEIPAEGIHSRTLHNDDDIKLVYFGFAQGEELSEHTASMPAILEIIRGEAELVLGEDTMHASAGSWVHMPANLPHSVLAKTPTILLLTLLKQG